MVLPRIFSASATNASQHAENQFNARSTPTPPPPFPFSFPSSRKMRVLFPFRSPFFITHNLSFLFNLNSALLWPSQSAVSSACSPLLHKFLAMDHLHRSFVSTWVTTVIRIRTFSKNKVRATPLLKNYASAIICFEPLFEMKKLVSPLVEWKGIIIGDPHSPSSGVRIVFQTKNALHSRNRAFYKSPFWSTDFFRRGKWCSAKKESSFVQISIPNGRFSMKFGGDQRSKRHRSSHQNWFARKRGLCAPPSCSSISSFYVALIAMD